MKLESFYEALRRNLNRLQPDYTQSDWERFREEVPLPSAPLWRARWVQAAALVLALGLGGALVYFLYNGRQTHLQERVQQLTRQRDSLLSLQPARPDYSVPLRADSALGTQAPYSSADAPKPRPTPTRTPEMLAAAQSRPDSVSEPGTESFDAWFNSILHKKPGSAQRSAVEGTRPRKTATRQVSKKAPGTPSRARRAKRVKRALKKTLPAVAQRIPAQTDARLLPARTQKRDLDPIPLRPVQLLPVRIPALSDLSPEQVQQQFGGPTGTLVPSPGP